MCKSQFITESYTVSKVLSISANSVLFVCPLTTRWLLMCWASKGMSTSTFIWMRKTDTKSFEFTSGSCEQRCTALRLTKYSSTPLEAIWCNLEAEIQHSLFRGLRDLPLKRLALNKCAQKVVCVIRISTISREKWNSVSAINAFSQHMLSPKNAFVPKGRLNKEVMASGPYLFKTFDQLY